MNGLGNVSKFEFNRIYFCIERLLGIFLLLITILVNFFFVFVKKPVNHQKRVKTKNESKKKEEHSLFQHQIKLE